MATQSSPERGASHQSGAFRVTAAFTLAAPTTPPRDSPLSGDRPWYRIASKSRSLESFLDLTSVLCQFVGFYKSYTLVLVKRSASNFTLYLTGPVGDVAKEKFDCLDGGGYPLVPWTVLALAGCSCLCHHKGDGNNPWDEQAH